eukprot:EG_transcript_15583
MRQTNWTKDLLVTQLKLLLQCNGMPTQKDTWIEKLLCQFIFNGHNPNADVTSAAAHQMLAQETCRHLASQAPNREELLALFPEFLKLYRDHLHRPIEFNPLGQRLSHSFATWFHVKRMQPKYIIESGVHNGHTTWLMRQAAPNAAMVMLDPAADLIKFWDRRAGSVYFVGDHGWQRPPSLARLTIRPWVDFRDVDWSFISPQDKRDHTLLLIDDLQDEWARLQEVQRLGFKRVMFANNWFPRSPERISRCRQCCGTRPLCYTRRSAPKDAPGNAALVYLTAGFVAPPLVQSQANFDRLRLGALPLREFWYYASHCLVELH